MNEEKEWSNKSASEPNARGNDTGEQNRSEEPEDIREGAHEEDQLEKLRRNAPEGGRDEYPERQQGTPPVSHVDNGSPEDHGHASDEEGD